MIESSRLLNVPSQDPWKNLTERQKLECYHGEKSLIPELHLIGHFDFREALRDGHGPGVHSKTHEVTYIIRGKVRWWIDNRAYEAKAGDLFLVPRGKLHWGDGFTMEPITGYWFRIMAKKTKPLPDLDNVQTRQIYEMLENPKNPCFPAVPEIEPVFGALLKEHRRPSECSSSVARALLHQILFLTLRSHRLFSQHQSSPLSSADDKISSILKYLQENLQENPSLEDLALFAKMAPNELRVLFRKKIQMTPNEYQNNLRLKIAKSQLLNPNKSITRIGMDLGFNSSQYFSTFFQKFSGISPSQFRKENSSSQKDFIPDKPYIVDL